MQQLPLNIKPAKKNKAFYVECGRLGGLKARKTKKRLEAGRRNLMNYNERRKLALRKIAGRINAKNAKGINAGKIFPEFIMEKGKIYLPFMEKDGRVTMTKQILSKALFWKFRKAHFI